MKLTPKEKTQMFQNSKLAIREYSSMIKKIINIVDSVKKTLISPVEIDISGEIQFMDEDFNSSWSDCQEYSNEERHMCWSGNS